MALIVLHESKDSVVKVADNQEEAIFLLPNLEHYQSLGLVHEITADEKEGIIKGTKRFDVMENDAPVIIDVQSYVSIPDAASMAGIIEKHILKHKELLQVDRVKADADYKQKVENNISVLSEDAKRGAEGYKIVFIHPKSTGGILVELAEKS